MDDEDDDPYNQNVTYQASFPIYAPGNYRLLVMLESMRNASDTFDDELISDAVCGKLGSYICMGERVSRSRATVHVDFDAPSYQTDAAVYKATLPRCEYKAANSYHDNFEWTSRALLETQGFDPKTTGIYPREIMPNQEFVWHSRTCQQPWVSPQSVLDLALGFKESAAIPDSEPGLVIGVLGTSRMKDVYTSMFQFLGANDDDTGPVVMQFSFIFVYDNRVKSMTNALKKAFFTDMDQVCVQRNKDRPDAPKVALLISHAIWEASYHNSYKDRSEHPSKFRFEENARNTLEFVRDRCHGQDYRVVLMTNPAVQLTDRRVPDPYTAVEGPRLVLTAKSHNHAFASRGARIDVANRAWKKIAAEYDVPIVDGEAISFPRWDMCADNMHYRNWKEKHTKKIVNEVTMAMVHLLLAALLRAFDH